MLEHWIICMMRCAWIILNYFYDVLIISLKGMRLFAILGDHRSKLSRVFVCFHFCNVVLYIEKGNSLSVRTGFLVELVSSWTRAKCKQYTTNCIIQNQSCPSKKSLESMTPKKQYQSYYDFCQIRLQVCFSICNVKVCIRRLIEG